MRPDRRRGGRQRAELRSDSALIGHTGSGLDPIREDGGFCFETEATIEHPVRGLPGRFMKLYAFPTGPKLAAANTRWVRRLGHKCGLAVRRRSRPVL